MKVTVIQKFYDIYYPSIIYQVGQEIEGFDSDRINDLVKKGVIKIEDMEKSSATVNIYQSAQHIKKEVAECSDIVELKRVLEDERKQEKPRKGVLSMITDRIEELE